MQIERTNQACWISSLVWIQWRKKLWYLRGKRTILTGLSGSATHWPQAWCITWTLIFQVKKRDASHQVNVWRNFNPFLKVYNFIYGKKRFYIFFHSLNFQVDNPCFLYATILEYSVGICLYVMVWSATLSCLITSRFK